MCRAPRRFSTLADPRIVVLLEAPCLCALQVGGVRSRGLRPLLQRLLGTSHTANHMTYDLRRRGLTVRIPHTHHSFITPLGFRFAFAPTRIHRPRFKPARAALLPSPTDPPLGR